MGADEPVKGAGCVGEHAPAPDVAAPSSFQPGPDFLSDEDKPRRPKVRSRWTDLAFNTGCGVGAAAGLAVSVWVCWASGRLFTPGGIFAFRAWYEPLVFFVWAPFL